MKRLESGTIIKLVILVMFLVLLVYLTMAFVPRISGFISSPAAFREYLLTYGAWSVPVFILFQILQVVIAVIPGEAIQVAAGYVFGTVMGTIYSSFGIFLGSLVAFTAARLLGYPLLKLFISPLNLEKFKLLMNQPRTEAITFILFLIPGLPKDILTYIAGVTPIKPHIFFLIAIIGRLPGILGSTYIGSHIQEGEYMKVLIVSGIALALFVAGLLYKDKILELMKKRHSK